MRYLITALLLAAGLITAVGCGGAKPRVFGRAVPEELPKTPISAIISEPLDYNGKIVVVTGTIKTECPSGCWFWLEQDGSRVYVTTSESNFSIPQLVNRNVKVYGHVITQEGQPRIIALGAQTI